MSIIIQAAQFAAHAHKGQVRKYNGRPYITHPIRVAGRAATHENATEVIVAVSYLHDTIEDCGVSYSTIQYHFDEPIAHLVDELTNDNNAAGNRAERKAAQRIKIKGNSYEAKLIKLIDRIDNLYELDWADQFAKIYAGESLLLLDEALVGTDKDLEDEFRGIVTQILA